MSRSLEDLEPNFRAVLEETLDGCRRLGVHMVPFFTLRNPWEQAKLWRQSRTRKTIDDTIRELKASEAHYLAEVIESVGPQYGRYVTDLIPGLSWHQWGEAADCYWRLDQEAVWSSRQTIELSDGRKLNGYRVYAEEAQRRGLVAGGFWSRLKDWSHVQRRTRGVRHCHTLAEVDREMRLRFG